MGTIADKLQKLLDTKNAIKAKLIDKGVYISDDDAFASYPDKIDEIPNDALDLITSYSTNPPSFFYNDTINTIGRGGLRMENLSRVYLPKVNDVYGKAFSESGVQVINFGDMDFTSSALPSEIFKKCVKLPSIEIPTSISYINTECFTGCSLLKCVILRNVDKIVTLSNINCFEGTPIAEGNGYIYVHQSLIEEYKIATNWIVFKDQFRVIEDYPEICDVNTTLNISNIDIKSGYAVQFEQFIKNQYSTIKFYTHKFEGEISNANVKIFRIGETIEEKELYSPPNVKVYKNHFLEWTIKCKLSKEENTPASNVYVIIYDNNGKHSQPLTLERNSMQILNVYKSEVTG